MSQRGCLGIPASGDTQVTTGWRVKPGHANHRMITWYPLMLLASPVSSTHDAMSRMTSVSGNRLLLLAVGGPAERGQEQKHRLEEHLRTFEAVRDRPPAARSPGERGPGTRSALRPIAAVAPRLSCEGAGLSVDSHSTPPLRTRHVRTKRAVVLNH